MITFYFPLSPKDRNEVIKWIGVFDNIYQQEHMGATSSGTFGHIVLGDYNLEDDSLLWCLRNDSIQNWYGNAELEFYPKDSVEPIDKYRSYELDFQRDDIIMFLRWLLTIDEDIRCGEGEE